MYKISVIISFILSSQRRFRDTKVHFVNLSAKFIMSSERNNDTKEAITKEIKSLQSQCIDTFKIIENTYIDIETPDNSREKTLCYIEGLKLEIENSHTPIATDPNLLTSQFLIDIKAKTSQLEELTAFVKGSIYDVENEINRLKNQLKVVDATIAHPKTNTKEITPQHLLDAKNRFLVMKNELHGLIHSLFPASKEVILDIMRDLMAERTNEETNGYITVTSENYGLIVTLRDMKIVTTKPYNDLEVKLAY